MIYYIETNLIAIVIAVILLVRGKGVVSKNESSHMVMDHMLWMLIILSISDVFAYYFRGKSAVGIELFNVLYFVTMNLGTYLWFIFVLVKMGYANKIRRTILWTCGPAAILCLAILTNPLTHFFFTVDENLIYHRGDGVFLVWVVEWSYMLAAFIINLKSVIREKRLYRKKEFRGYLLFASPMLLAAAAQMFFYGTTTAQIGYMLGLLLVYVNQQFYQVQRDDLTGLNNKNAYLNYQDSIFIRYSEVDLTLFMMDGDNFKAINDTYGHVKGDQALRDIADVLKNALSDISSSRAVLFRYGGDEFIIVGRDMKEEDAEHLKDNILKECVRMNEHNKSRHREYELSISVGSARKTCHGLDDFNELVRAADEDMYRVKQNRKHRE